MPNVMTHVEALVWSVRQHHWITTYNMALQPNSLSLWLILCRDDSMYTLYFIKWKELIPRKTSCIARFPSIQYSRTEYNRIDAISCQFQYVEQRSLCICSKHKNPVLQCRSGRFKFHSLILSCRYWSCCLQILKVLFYNSSWED